MTAGIYTIFHRASGRQYIGSSKHIESRWVSHRYDLTRGQHPCQYLQRAWNKYGEDAFEFVIIQVIPDYEGRMAQEDYFLKNVDLLYNTRTTAFVTTPQAEEKMGKSLRGRKRKPEHVAKSAAGNTGKKRSEKVRADMSARRKGKPLSEKHKQALTGRRWGDEPREALSKKQKANWERRKAEGFKWSDEVVKKRNEAIRKSKQANPYIPTPDVKKSMSEGQKRRQERERQLRNDTTTTSN